VKWVIGNMQAQFILMLTLSTCGPQSCHSKCMRSLLYCGACFVIMVCSTITKTHQHSKENVPLLIS
jgi:hypothetical protein